MGLELDMEAAVVEAVAEAAAVDTPVEAVAEAAVVDTPVEAVAEAVVAPAAKRQKTWSQVPPEAKDFLLDYIRVQRARGWSLIRSVNHVKALAPQVYGHLQPDAVRRWKPSSAPSGPGSGRKKQNRGRTLASAC
jgi:hypothetical protein